MLQGHSDGEGMSLVLASLSSAFYTCDSKILWYKEKKMSCESCVFSSEGPFGPPHPRSWFWNDTAKGLWVTFLLFAVTCIFSMTLCFNVEGGFFLVRYTSASLFSQTWLHSLFVQGLVDECASMWRRRRKIKKKKKKIAVVVNLWNVWEIKEASLKQAARENSRAEMIRFSARSCQMNPRGAEKHSREPRKL